MKYFCMQRNCHHQRSKSGCYLRVYCTHFQRRQVLHMMNHRNPLSSAASLIPRSSRSCPPLAHLSTPTHFAPPQHAPHLGQLGVPRWQTPMPLPSCTTADSLSNAPSAQECIAGIHEVPNNLAPPRQGPHLGQLRSTSPAYFNVSFHFSEAGAARIYISAQLLERLADILQCMSILLHHNKRRQSRSARGGSPAYSNAIQFCRHRHQAPASWSARRRIAGAPQCIRILHHRSSA